MKGERAREGERRQIFAWGEGEEEEALVVTTSLGGKGVQGSTSRAAVRALIWQ